MNLNELRAKRAALIAEARAMVDAAKGENRDLTAEEQAAVDAKLTEADKFQAKIHQLEKLESAEASLAAPVPRVGQPVQPGSTGEQRPYVVPAGRPPRGYATQEQAYRAGSWLAATLFGHAASRQYCQEHGLAIGAVMGTTSNTAGGYLVPEEFNRAVIDLREQYGVFRQRVQVLPMASDVMVIPRRAGGLTAFFTTENADMSAGASDKSWDAVTLTARKMAVLTRYSTELADDAVISIAGDLAQEVAYAFALKEDQCGFLGDGTSTYGGIVGLANKIGSAGIYTAPTGHVGFDTLTMADFTNTIAKLPAYALPNAAWFIHASGFAASMQNLMYAAGGNTVDMISGATARSFLGYPVIVAQVLNGTLGSDTSKIKCYFGDLRLTTTMGERRGVALRTSDDRYFEFDQIGILATQRVDIIHHDVGDSSNAGPVVALKTAAS